MTPERWQRVAAIFDAAAERPPQERDAFLLQACDGDADLRREVESLLRQDVSRDSAIERVAVDAGHAPPFPSSIGRYRIRALLGEGGMGAVYEAEQDHPQRTVALKVLKSAWAGPQLIRRFALESNALARLEHPGIARIYDAGTAPSNWGPQPYIAMELIRGLPMLEYAARHQLSTPDRLRLFIKICDAVEYAHRHRIVHRDLKPGNILVDSNGQPTVLDFGVARLTDVDESRSALTKLGDVVGTIAYMSPEQVSGDPSLLDARSDVYSLGVLLYELLAGQLPYAVPHQLADAARVLRDEEPPALSTMNRALRGDLDIIVAKALEKDSARRYASAGEMGDDLRRHLSDRPILAVPPTATYRIRKLVRRHRTLVGATAAVFVVLLAGIAVATHEAIQARRERDRAVNAERTANAVNDFLQNDLLAQAGARAQASARTDMDPNLTVRTALDRAAERIGGRFAMEPAVEASIRKTIGSAYFDLNRMSEAEAQLQRAADLEARAFGPDHPDTLATLDTLGVVYNYEAEYSTAEAVLTKVFQARRRTLGNTHKDTLAAMSHLALAIAYEGDDVRALALFEPLLEAQRRLYGEDNLDTVETMDSLGTRYDAVGRFAEAEALLDRAVQISGRIRGPQHPDTISSMHTLATVYRAEGKYAQADALLLAAIDSRTRALGEDHWETQNSRFSLAISYRAQQRYAEAEPLFTLAISKLQRTLPDHPLRYQAMYHLGEMYRRQRRFREAESILTTVVAARRRLLGDQNSYTAQALESLGALRLDEKKFADAEAPLRAALKERDVKDSGRWERFYAMSLLGESLAGQARAAEAEPLLRSAYDGLLARASTIPVEFRPVVEQAHRWVEALPAGGVS